MTSSLLILILLHFCHNCFVGSQHILCSTAVFFVLQKAVRRHFALLQTELDHLKAKLNAQSNTDLLSPTQNCKLELLLFYLAYIKVADILVVAVHVHVYQVKLEVWASAQRDGRPAEYRWRRLFNATKFG